MLLDFLYRLICVSYLCAKIILKFNICNKIVTMLWILIKSHLVM